MHFYYIWVRSNRYHGSEPLTYASELSLHTGAIVDVELQKEPVLGLVVGSTSKPRFKTKTITRVYDLPVIPQALIKVSQWLQSYYPAPIGILTQQLLPASLSEKQLKTSILDNFSDPVLDSLPPLSKEQLAALDLMKVRNTYLLHGKTGSGKTRIYIELAAQAILNDTSAIILTPEISLTSQLANSFYQVFGERVVVIHSQQTPSERQKAWLDCLRSTRPLIAIGPRSALFIPLSKVGLIVLDESHESAYKQEQAPQYQTGRVASYMAGLYHASLVLGSATPSVSDYYIAEQKNKPIVKLTQLAQTIKQPDTITDIVDMKDHSLFSRSPQLSLPLIKAIEKALSRGEQSLLYLNRRGTARLIMCEKCGWQAACPHCDVPLTYHGDDHELRCHSCNYHSPVLSNCPNCEHPSIVFKTAGTKAIVEEVKRLFPNARIGRYDTDNAKSERFEQHYAAIYRGEIDILIGTQLLAKGLDLPKLSTLGIVLADTSLYMPDFSAQERTYQLISQVLGRVGRGHVAGHAIIQTYHPDHPVLKQAIGNDYQKMYRSELVSRKQFLFPPFCYLLKLTTRRVTLKSAENAALKLLSNLNDAQHHVRIEGPAPAFYEKFQNKYQWQLVVKSLERSELLKIISELPASWSYDLDPIDLL